LQGRHRAFQVPGGGQHFRLIGEEVRGGGKIPELRREGA
jgi:hypothetical protein